MYTAFLFDITLIYSLFFLSEELLSILVRLMSCGLYR